MRSGIYRLKKDIILANDGDQFHMSEDSYETEICDFCGMKRKCYWFEAGTPRLTGVDCCSTCAKTTFQLERIE